MTDLADACAELATWLDHAQELIAEPDTDGTTTHGQPGSRPPWNQAAANAWFDAHAGVRDLEARLLAIISDQPATRRGGSDNATQAAIESIERHGPAIPDTEARHATTVITTWIRRIQELPAIDQAEPWRRIPAPCPYCGHAMLRVRPRSGQVTCLRIGACHDRDGHHPEGHLDVSQLNGNPIIRWRDGLVAP